MSRLLKVLVGTSVLIALLSVGALIYIWYCRQDELFVGSLFTTVIGLLTVVLAILIYREQQLSQERSHQEQLSLQEQLRDRVFGVMGKFEHVYLEVARLIEDANNRPDSKLAIMMYWLWFGIDQRLYENTTVSLDALLPNESRVRRLLVERIDKGLDTTVVLYDPTEVADKLKAFIKAVMTWQIHRKDIESGATPPTRNINDEEVSNLFVRYVADLAIVNNRRLETRDTKFRELKLRHTIPMLMYAVEVPGGGSRGLVYLGETDALARDAKTGGFISEDSRIVEVLMEQIWTEELPVPRADPTSAS